MFYGIRVLGFERTRVTGFWVQGSGFRVLGFGFGFFRVLRLQGFRV